MPGNEKLKFELEVDDNGTIKVRRFKREMVEAERGGIKFGRSAGGIGRKLGGLTLSAAGAALKFKDHLSQVDLRHDQGAYTPGQIADEVFREGPHGIEFYQAELVALLAAQVNSAPG